MNYWSGPNARTTKTSFNRYNNRAGRPLANLYERKMKQKILAAKTPRIAGFIIGTLSLPAYSTGIPVFDAATASQSTISAVQNTISAVEDVTQTVTQIDMLKDQAIQALSPASMLWDAAHSNVSGLLGQIDTLSGFKEDLGGIDGFLGEFQDIGYYKQLSCFTSDGCTDNDRTTLLNRRDLASEAQKKANDAMFRGLEKQQDSMQTDAKRLEQIQSSTQAAQGRMQAIQSGNQLASHQANQLLQILGLMVAEQNALATRMQAEADREAVERAAHVRLFNMGGKTDHSKNKGF